MEGNLPFLLCFTLYLRAISKYKPPGGLYLEGRSNGGFSALLVWGGLIFGGDYFRNFTVSERLEKARKKEFWIGMVKRATETCNLFCSIVQIELKAMLRVFFF